MEEVDSERLLISMKCCYGGKVCHQRWWALVCLGTRMKIWANGQTLILDEKHSFHAQTITVYCLFLGFRTICFTHQPVKIDNSAVGILLHTGDFPTYCDLQYIGSGNTRFHNILGCFMPLDFDIWRISVPAECKNHQNVNMCSLTCYSFLKISLNSILHILS